MSMLAHFEEWSSEDRRRAMRRSLKLGIDGGGDKVTIHDLSLTGALLETNTPMLVGAAFELELPQAGSVEAVIMWNSGVPRTDITSSAERGTAPGHSAKLGGSKESDDRPNHRAQAAQRRG